MMQRIGLAARGAYARADAFLTRRRILSGALLAVLLAGALALYNVSSGPLSNLNDIGGWANRALFIGLTAAVHAAALLACALLCGGSFAHLALRQIILTAGMYILLLPINQKSYAYVQALQPVIRAMDAGGLAAGAALEAGLSAPMLTLVYAITRGPVYDMYMLKLFAIGCMLITSLLITRAADRRGMGWRAETLLALCMILPQGLMNAACSALPETAAVMLLGVSLSLAFACDRSRMWLSAVCFGAAAALSGAALYALPVYLWLAARGRMKGTQLAAALGVMLLGCLPAIASGVPAAQALGSLLGANLGLPAYASGAPGLMNLIPRAAIEEMPQYAPILRHLDALDTATNAQQYYTQAHFEHLSSGFVLISLALYLGVCALAHRAQDKTPLHRAMTMTLGALICCPNTTAAAWLALDVLCLYAILAEPKLRLPACLTLFATMTSSAYPLTEEALLPMVYAFALCLLALCLLLDIIPLGKEKTHE